MIVENLQCIHADYASKFMLKQDDFMSNYMMNVAKECSFVNISFEYIVIITLILLTR